MMKKLILAGACVALLSSCNGTKKTETVIVNEQISTATSTNDSLITEVDQYFATFIPTEVTTMVVGKDEFAEKFNPARTMDNAPTIVDFETYRVGAIVVPETAKETSIVLDDISIVDRKLVVNYSINQQGEDRSFTILPVKLFQYSLQLDIDSVSFVNNNTTKTYAK